MSELKTYFEYEFLNKFEYISKGEPIAASKITIQAPSTNQARDALILDQEFEKAQINIIGNFTKSLGQENLSKLVDNRREDSKKSADEDEKPMTRELVVKNLLSGNADINKCLVALKNILTYKNKNGNKTVALIDDIENMTSTIFNDISLSDMKNILGEYILNFLYTSPDN